MPRCLYAPPATASQGGARCAAVFPLRGLHRGLRSKGKGVALEGLMDAGQAWAKRPASGFSADRLRGKSKKAIAPTVGFRFFLAA